MRFRTPTQHCFKAKSTHWEALNLQRRCFKKSNVSKGFLKITQTLKPIILEKRESSPSCTSWWFEPRLSADIPIWQEIFFISLRSPKDWGRNGRNRHRVPFWPGKTTT